MTEKINVYPKFLEAELVTTIYQMFHIKYCSNSRWFTFLTEEWATSDSGWVKILHVCS